MEIKSPITNSNNVRLAEEFAVKTIVERYKKLFQLEVGKFFSQTEKVAVYECLDTGYKFFYPFGLGGDSDFYGYLNKFPWYYMPWKWELEKAMGYVAPGMEVLEIGCAKGDFLKKIIEAGASATGLELSQSAAEYGRKQGLVILEEKIEEHALKNKDKYDFVCLFQVFEHIDNVGEFFRAALEVLKPGGKILISVPNNDSFLGRDSQPSLNLPPHHLGWWNTRSLISLGNFFGAELLDLSFEPLQDYHLPYYYQVVFGDAFARRLGQILGKIINKIIRPIFCLLLRPFAKDIVGHTIMAVYGKK
jgi:SAM-dependent methyltransferase